MWVWIRYLLERWVLRGSFALVALLVAILTIVAVSGATVAYLLPAGYFGTYREALWWTVLRLSDTGYLSDDTGGFELRALSIALSVLGMSVTVGGIVAIVTQLINRGLRALSAATTPVPFSDHVVILGFSDRTPRLIRNLLARGSFNIVVLVDTVDESYQRKVNRAVPGPIDRERVVLRSGSARRPLELEHAAVSRARAVIFPASQLAIAGDPEAGPRILQTVLALKKVLEPLDDPPQVAVELVDRGLRSMVTSTFPAVRVLQSDRLVARVFRFALQGTGLVEFAIDVVDPDDGFRIEERVFPELLGETLGAAERRLLGGRLMGMLVSDGQVGRRLVTDEGAVIERSAPLLVFTKTAMGVADRDAVDRAATERAAASETTAAPVFDFSRPELNVLVLGWNECAPDLIAELNLEGPDRYRVDFVSRAPVVDRTFELERLVGEMRVKIRHFAHDPMDIDGDDEIRLATYDRVVVLADRSVPPEGADVRTLAVVMALGARRDEMKAEAYVLVELLEEENAGVLGDIQAVVTARLAADTLCSLALTPGADDTLQMSLGHQLTFVTRIFTIPEQLAKDKVTLSGWLRQRGMGYLHTLDETGATRRILVCEAAIPAKFGLKVSGRA